MPNRTLLIAGALLLGLVCGAAAGEHSPVSDRAWRRRAHVPPPPYPYALKPSAERAIPRLHINPRARVPRTPYPEALHPEQPLLLPQGFTMTVTRVIGQSDDRSEAAKSASISRPRDIAETLADCWRPATPSDDQSREISLRLSFSRSGSVIGVPNITYAKAGPNQSDAAALRSSILSAVSACTPLRFTSDLGSAIAGLPFAIRFVALRHAPAQSSPQ